MYPPGHIAINLVLLSSVNQVVRKKNTAATALPMWPAVVAALIPDLVDKVVCDYLHLAPYGRNWTHNLTAVLLFALVLGVILRSRPVAFSWALGHLGHLLGDFVFIPWLWPLFAYNWPAEDRQIAQGVVQTVVDLGQGHVLSSQAAAVWIGNRLLVETVFFVLATLFFWRQERKQAWSLPILLCVVVLWAWVIVVWDWQPFVWTWARYGIA